MASEIDAAFFTEVLESNKASVREAVKETILNSVKQQFQWELPETVKKVFSDFITEEVVPEIRAELEANKAAFVDAATEIARTAAAEVGKALQKQIAENLTKSWNLRNVVEALTR
ncbi:MAG: hypothetical protein V4661_15510 [Pseudomonadota bacterium]